ncbi:MAG TPA: hypothetical protein VK152_12960 [Paludibacter sp.]|nr:hypothetical protein [Paludibacter sp.]
MLMFENGLLASFIPQVLLVAGYLVCLFSGIFHSTAPAPEPQPVVVSVRATAHQQQKIYSVSIDEFMKMETGTIPSKFPSHNPKVALKHRSVESLFQLSDSISFIRFSRPPPSVIG